MRTRGRSRATSDHKFPACDQHYVFFSPFGIIWLLIIIIHNHIVYNKETVLIILNLFWVTTSPWWCDIKNLITDIIHHPTLLLLSLLVLVTFCKHHYLSRISLLCVAEKPNNCKLKKKHHPLTLIAAPRQSFCVRAPQLKTHAYGGLTRGLWIRADKDSVGFYCWLDLLQTKDQKTNCSLLCLSYINQHLSVVTSCSGQR